ncbi:hypothetical protein EVAR_102661_1 [Eumeta japonica]|uniref:Uncharacterized protein n=1 Tax=Eumeta variegata TaxID=151549 RepID=A0A4C1TUV1_EUMVA|nr:hypothetical protein EVAR_102661_1 [Eumeta japonica]
MDVVLLSFYLGLRASDLKWSGLAPCGPRPVNARCHHCDDKSRDLRLNVSSVAQNEWVEVARRAGAPRAPLLPPLAHKVGGGVVTTGAQS